MRVDTNIQLTIIPQLCVQMNLPLCTPDKIDCVRNIETEYKECLPQCSGLWVLSYNQEKGLKGGQQSLKRNNFYQASGLFEGQSCSQKTVEQHVGAFWMLSYKFLTSKTWLRQFYLSSGNQILFVPYMQNLGYGLTHIENQALLSPSKQNHTVVLIRKGYFVLLNYSYKSWSIIKKVLESAGPDVFKTPPTCKI